MMSKAAITALAVVTVVAVLAPIQQAAGLISADLPLLAIGEEKEIDISLLLLEEKLSEIKRLLLDLQQSLLLEDSLAKQHGDSLIKPLEPLITLGLKQLDNEIIKDQIALDKLKSDIHDSLILAGLPSLGLPKEDKINEDLINLENELIEDNKILKELEHDLLKAEEKGALLSEPLAKEQIKADVLILENQLAGDKIALQNLETDIAKAKLLDIQEADLPIILQPELPIIPQPDLEIPELGLGDLQKPDLIEIPIPRIEENLLPGLLDPSLSLKTKKPKKDKKSKGLKGW